MSVVNKMLNDLEQRESNAVGNHESYRPPESKKNNKRLVFYGVFGVLILAIVLWLVLTEPKSKPEPQRIAPNSSLVNANQDNQQTSGNTEQQSSILEPQSEEVAAGNDTAETETGTDEVMLKGESEEAVVPALEPESEADPAAEEIEDEATVATSNKQASKLAVSPSNGEQKTRHQMLVANALASNDRDTAKTALRKWLSEEPNNLEARKKLAALYFSDGQITEAESMLSAGRESHPNDPSVRLMQARFYMQSGKSQEAWDAVQLDSSEPSFLHYRAALARQMNNLIVAEQDYAVLTRLTPLDVKGWLGLAVVSESLDNRDEAVRAYTQVLRMSEGNEQLNAFAKERMAVLREKQ